ncbi:MAG: RdgB/HAM1 family non-canonical purine NTP pyrophosphatase [Pseudomonadota bacterium]|nr:RdgB/HAM1 family non-canonical purine NTP pyrophosphatase [Pseudomonadota bacterium]
MSEAKTPKIQELVIASNNAGKVAELKQMLAPLGIRVFAQNAFGLPSPEETGLTFIENAILKARFVAQETGKPALADDSGLCVPALGGAPGIYSARYSSDIVGEQANDASNNAKLINVLRERDLENTSAYYVCALALLRHADDPEPLISIGRLQGQIQFTAQGEGGFGYDPHFYLPKYQQTAAQLGKAKKNTISHRALALQQLVIELKEC